MYQRIIKPVLFSLTIERAHRAVLLLLRCIGLIPGGRWLLLFVVACFALSSMFSYSFYGNRCAAYLFGKRAILPYHIVYVLVAFLGAIGVGNVVWTMPQRNAGNTETV